jgi:hypothetical protein
MSQIDPVFIVDVGRVLSGYPAADLTHGGRAWEAGALGPVEARRVDCFCDYLLPNAVSATDMSVTGNTLGVSRCLRE